MSVFLSGQVATQEQIDSFNQLINPEASTIPTGFSGGEISETTSLSSSFQNSLARIQNILSGGELPETFRQSIFANNQIALGDASLDISQALASQSLQTNSSLQQLSGSLEEINARVSQQLQQLGQAVSQASEGNSTSTSPFAFLTENPLLGGLGIGALAVGGIALLLLIKR